MILMRKSSGVDSRLASRAHHFLLSYIFFAYFEQQSHLHAL